MVRIISISLLMVGISTSPIAGDPWSMGFYVPNPVTDAPYSATNSLPPGPVSDIHWPAMTHVVQFAYSPYSTGEIFDGNLGTTAQLVADAHANGVKVMMGFVSSEIMSTIVSNHFSVLTNAFNRIIQSNNFDGLDMDWENDYTSAAGELLFPALRQILGNKLLSVDVSPNASALFYPISTYCDRVNIMTYSMSKFHTTYSYFNSPLYGGEYHRMNNPYQGNYEMPTSIDKAVRDYISAGYPKSKLNIGLPFHGGKWLANPAIIAPRQAVSGIITNQSLHFRSVQATNDLSNPNYDVEAQQAWVNAGGLYTFENARSIQAKFDYIDRQQLGGAILWYLDGDYDSNAVPKHPLQKAVADSIALRSRYKLNAGTVQIGP